jgi:hypothetical protein
MKVKELIKLLEKEDQNKEVCTMEEDCGEWCYYSVDFIEKKDGQKYEHLEGTNTANIIVIQ